MSRRGFLGFVGTLAAGALAATGYAAFQRSSGQQSSGEGEMITLVTFGDSMLDCGHYNERGVHPGQLIVRNDDSLFPEFKGKDLSSRVPARLEHRATDGATVRGLPRQAQGLNVQGRTVAILTVGGNDLLQGLVLDSGPGVEAFEKALDAFVKSLPIRPLLIGNVYDPSFGDNSRNFLGVDPTIARRNHARVNDALTSVASRYGQLVDIHAHFLKGDPSWFTHTIEPSLVGASEVRRAFLPHVLGE